MEGQPTASCPGRYLILDGQQRIVTTLLIIAAAYVRLQEEACKEKDEAEKQKENGCDKEAQVLKKAAGSHMTLARQLLAILRQVRGCCSRDK